MNIQADRQIDRGRQAERKRERGKVEDRPTERLTIKKRQLNDPSLERPDKPT